jgi:hypothetical protein
MWISKCLRGVVHLVWLISVEDFNRKVDEISWLEQLDTRKNVIREIVNLGDVNRTILNHMKC